MRCRRGVSVGFEPVSFDASKEVEEAEMIRVQSYRRVLATAVLVLATIGSLSAQEFRATVRGQVVDSSKGALRSATVTLTNTATNETATAVTNGEGNYSVPFLRPGSYTMTVELSGFQKYTRSGMVLQVNET